MNPKDFIHLASGYAINPFQISHIDFRHKEVMIHIGSSAVAATGPDAAKLRDLFEPTHDEIVAEQKALAEKLAAKNAEAAKPEAPAVPVGTEPKVE